MSAAASGSPMVRTLSFYKTTIGKKAVMAVTGILLLGFVIAHLLGNLQIYTSREEMNAYAVFLRSLPAALWGARLVLLVSVILHITASIQLSRLKSAARPVRYVRKSVVQASYASRTMMWSGPIVAAFVVYHLLHLTFGAVHPNYQEMRPYENVVNGFRSPLVSGAYILAMVLLGLHLYHGIFSVFQTLGAGHPKYTPWLKRLAIAITIFIVGGNISIPISVMTGIVS